MATKKPTRSAKSKRVSTRVSTRKRSAKPSTIDQYLATVTKEQRAALQKLRATLHRIVPRAEECISYGVPGFRLDGRALVWFAAAKSHCSFFPGAAIADYADELRDFETSKGTIRFQPERLPPAGLIRKLVKARIDRLPKARVRTPQTAR